jgi:class 3 adenylate cyclase
VGITTGSERPATDRPTGTVAFRMSDIEGSTRLISGAGDAFPHLLDEHHALMRQAFRACPARYG